MLTPSADRRLTFPLVALLMTLAAAGCSSSFEDTLMDPGPDLSQFGSSQASLKSKAKDYFRQANFGLSQKTFEQVLSKDPKDGEAWLGLAAACDRLGRFDLSDKAYGKALALAGRRGEIVNNMAFSQLLRGQADKARQLFAEATKLAPGNAVIAANAKAIAAPPAKTS